MAERLETELTVANAILLVKTILFQADGAGFVIPDDLRDNNEMFDALIGSKIAECVEGGR